MFCTQEFNYRLNRVQERALRVILEDYISTFSDLVTLLNQKTILQRCINFSINEVFKYLNGLSPDLMNEVFRLKSHYHNLRNFSQFETYIPTTKSLLKSCLYKANQLWQLKPYEVRNYMSLTQFEFKISKWFCQEYQVHLCKQYIKNAGYIS